MGISHVYVRDAKLGVVRFIDMSIEILMLR